MLFENNSHQLEVLIGLYRLVYPNYEQISTIDGWPTINRKTWMTIAGMFREFDIKHHPEVMSGGCWMNTGFSTLEAAEDLKDWEVDKSTCKVILKNIKEPEDERTTGNKSKSFHGEV